MGKPAACATSSFDGSGKTWSRGSATWVEYPPNNVTPSTFAPGERSVTPSPTAATVPANSKPGVMGQPTISLAEAYNPMRMTQSA